MTRYTISISLVDDNIVEPTEALTARLVFTNTPSPLRVTLAPAVANITIFDDDSESLHVPPLLCCSGSYTKHTHVCTLVKVTIPIDL